MDHAFAQLFGGHELFVAPKLFRHWLATAKVKAAALSSADVVQAAVAAYAQRQVAPTLVGDVAVIEVNGPITYKSSWLSWYFGGANIQDLQQQHRLALADPAVRTLVYKYDSPGGVVDMVPEFADEIFQSRGQKPIVSVADTLIASAAYWLAAQADTIYASASAQLGSIGVYCEHDDISGMLEQAGIKITLIAHGDHKVDGNPYEPLSDEARADAQASVDEMGDWFEVAVARGRGVKKAVVLETFGQGKVFRGKQAIALGLADKLGTFSQVLAKLTKGRVGVSSARAAANIQDPHTQVGSEPLELTAKKAAGQCVACGRSSCACTAPECEPECPTCSPECGCRLQAAAKAEVAGDDEALVAVLGTDAI